MLSIRRIAARDAPQHPAALLRRCISMSSNPRIPSAGDPFTVTLPEPNAEQRRLSVLVERLAHDLLGDRERQELRDRVIRIRRKLGLAR
jgi:hypothetical protein